MARAKKLLTTSLMAILVLVIFQNVASVETTVLFWSIRLPRVVLLVTVAAVGALFGYWAGRRRNAREKPTK